ncbi:MAG: type II secretion system secretin GspD [Gammaproteobacteria bacterium]
MKKSAALGISRSGGARNPHVFQYTLRLLASSLRLAPSGHMRRFVPDETVLCSGGTRDPIARDDFFTSSEGSVGRGAWKTLGALCTWIAVASALGATAQEPYTLNFKDADIRAFIETVSRITGKNFVVDPRVAGNVTVISARATNPKTLYAVFLSVLKVHGFTAVPSGEVIKILPEPMAKSSGGPTVSRKSKGGGDEIVTLIIDLHNVSAAEVVPVLRPLMAAEAHLAAHLDSNVLIASDSAANIERLAEIIERIDQTGEREIEAIRLRHADAEELVQVLNSLRQSGASVEGGVGRKPPVISADKRTNTVLIGGDRGARLDLRTLIYHLDTPIEREGDIEVIYLRYAVANDLVPILQGIGGKADAEGSAASTAGEPPPTPGLGLTGDVEIQADENTNALVIQADPGRMQALRSVIERLDIRRAQVQVEGIIAEVSNTKAAELGVQWRTAVPSSGVFGGTTFPGAESDLIDEFDPGALALGLSLAYFRGGDIRALLRALSTDNATNVLSTPTLVTMDNEEAEIVVGQNVPFVTGSFTTPATTPDNPFQTIQREDVGVVLKVKPQINEGDAIKLEIEQEVSSVDRSSTIGADLITNKRSVKTNVLVDDGKIIVLGGLIQDDLRDSEQKIPFLGDIPVLGQLFRNTRSDAIKTNLMVFLRPRIIRDAHTAAGFTADKYNYIRDQQIDLGEHTRSVLPEAPRPRLPEFDTKLERPPNVLPRARSTTGKRAAPKR